MENREQAAFVAGFLEGIKHYAWWVMSFDAKQRVVGQRKVPLDEALALGEKEALYYFEEFQKRENS